MKESMFTDLWLIESSSGIREEKMRHYELTLTGATGVDFYLNGWRIGIGLDFPWIDVPIPSIPGMHLQIGRGGKIR